MAEIMPAGQAGDFYSYLTDQVGLPETFPPSASALRAMTKYVGSGGGLSISFDQKLLGERIVYDAATDTLTIHGLPPNLKDQLSRNNQ
jgi:nucleoid-associated protein